MNTEETDFEALMEEPPGGYNHGRHSRVLKPEDSPHSRWQPLDRDGQAARAYLTETDGWSVVSGNSKRRGGMFALRGILDEDAHIDPIVLEIAVERELGFTIDGVHSVYRQGRLTTEQRELRGHIDARLLALSRAGGNMTALAHIFGWEMTSGGSSERCKTMERAIARARSAEAASDE